MRAARYHGPEDVRVEDIDEPGVEPGSVKIEVTANGICGSDLHEYTVGPIFIPTREEPHPVTGASLPVVMGHELGGRVVAVGEGVESVAEGDLVAVEPIVRDEECPECRRGAYNLCRNIGFHGLTSHGGGLAQYTVVPQKMVHHVPDEFDEEMVALVEPVAVGFHAVRISGYRPGDSALVLGAGPIGIVTMLALRAAGARRVIVSEMAEARKSTAREHGADVVIDPGEDDVIEVVNDLTGGLGADVAFDCAGVQATWTTAVNATRPEGTIVSVAIWEEPVEMDLNQLVLTERRTLGSIAYVGVDFPATISLMADGRIPAKDLITKRIDLDDIVDEGFEELVHNRDAHVKILVTP